MRQVIIKGCIVVAWVSTLLWWAPIGLGLNSPEPLVRALGV